MTGQATRDWLDSLFNLAELLSLSVDEFVQLHEVRGDLSLTAAWWRHRRSRRTAWAIQDGKGYPDGRRDNPSERSAWRECRGCGRGRNDEPELQRELGHGPLLAPTPHDRGIGGRALARCAAPR
jgi:hypothetical protein